MAGQEVFERLRRVSSDSGDRVADDVQLAGGDLGVGADPCFNLPIRRAVGQSLDAAASSNVSLT